MLTKKTTWKQNCVSNRDFYEITSIIIVFFERNAIERDFNVKYLTGQITSSFINLFHLIVLYYNGTDWFGLSNFEGLFFIKKFSINVYTIMRIYK